MNRFELVGTGTKNILVLNGVHGNELTPVHLGYNLVHMWNGSWGYKLDLTKFKGLTIISALNTDGIKKNTRDIPSDGTNDLNRMFSVPQEEDITTDDLQLLFDFSDIIIDVHSSPRCTEFALINQDEYSNSYVEFCQKMDINYLIRYSEANTIKKYGLDKGKISFTIEINQMNYIDFESSKKATTLVNRIINNHELFEMKKEEPKYPEYFELYTYKSGLFIPEHSLGSVVQKGDKLGQILDLTTLEMSELRYTKNVSSRIICCGESSFVSPSNSLYFLQPI